MPVQQIIIQSLSGYLFVIPMLIFYWIALFRSGNKQSLLRIVAILAFGYYLIGVLTVTGIHELKAFSPRLVLVPFLDMIRGPMDTVLNIILFLPFGFFLPLLYRKYNRAIQVVFAGFLLSLSIEVLQMFGMGTTDINDLITNTIGAFLGYGIYTVLSNVTPQGVCGRFYAAADHEQKELLLLVVYSFAIMVTVQPVVVSRLFGLG